MRLNDIKPKKKIKEQGVVSTAWKQFKNRHLPGGDREEGEMSVAEKMGKDRFIQQFVSRAYATLNSEIQSGRVDPNLQSQAPGPSQPAAKEPAAPSAAPAQPPQAQSLDLDAYKKRREAERAAGVQGQQAAQAQMQQTAAANAAASAQDNQLVAKVRAEKQKPGFQQDKGLIRQAAARGIHETKYQKLNSIFESLLTEAESVGQFFRRWLPTYMRRVNMNDPHTIELIQKIEDTYAQDKGRAALAQLAHAAYAASYAPGYGSEQPAGQRQPAGQPAPQKPSAAQPADMYGQVVKSLDALKGQPNYAEVLKNLSAEITKRQSEISSTPTGTK